MLIIPHKRNIMNSALDSEVCQNIRYDFIFHYIEIILKNYGTLDLVKKINNRRHKYKILLRYIQNCMIYFNGKLNLNMSDNDIFKISYQESRKYLKLVQL